MEPVITQLRPDIHSFAVEVNTSIAQARARAGILKDAKEAKQLLNDWTQRANELSDRLLNAFREVDHVYVESDDCQAAQKVILDRCTEVDHKALVAAAQCYPEMEERLETYEVDIRNIQKMRSALEASVDAITLLVEISWNRSNESNPN